jgi:hypothetical protein
VLKSAENFAMHILANLELEHVPEMSFCIVKGSPKVLNVQCKNAAKVNEQSISDS